MQKIGYIIRLQAIKYRKIVNIMELLKIGEKQNNIIIKIKNIYKIHKKFKAMRPHTSLL